MTIARRIPNPLLSFSTTTFLSSIIFQTYTSSQRKIFLKHQPCSSSFTPAFLLSLAPPPSSSRAVRPPDIARTLASLASSIGVVPSQQRAPTPPAASPRAQSYTLRALTQKTTICAPSCRASRWSPGRRSATGCSCHDIEKACDLSAVFATGFAAPPARHVRHGRRMLRRR